MQHHILSRYKHSWVETFCNFANLLCIQEILYPQKRIFEVTCKILIKNTEKWSKSVRKSAKASLSSESLTLRSLLD